jgi:hypothetical protein
MRIFKTKWFHRWAAKEDLTEAVLRTAAHELKEGLGDALGGHVYKKRVALPGRGKRAGARTLVAYRSGQVVFFMYGFPKNERANIEHDELKALRLLAKELLGYSTQELAKAVEADELIEVSEYGKA